MKLSEQEIATLHMIAQFHALHPESKAVLDGVINRALAEYGRPEESLVLEDELGVSYRVAERYGQPPRVEYRFQSTVSNPTPAWSEFFNHFVITPGRARIFVRLFDEHDRRKNK